MRDLAGVSEKMCEMVIKIIFGILALVIWILVVVGNYHYQRKARLYADELLKDNPEEWIKRIKANAWRCLISRGIWGLLFASFIYNIWNVSQEIIIFKLIMFFGGVLFIVWGIAGFRGEMKRLQDLK